jgi:flagellar biosynthesis protein FlhA
MDSKTEEMLLRAYQKTEAGVHLSLEPGYFEKLVKSVQKTLENTVFSHGTPVLLCHPILRAQLRKLLERFIPSLQILSANEIAPFARVKSLAAVQT